MNYIISHNIAFPHCSIGGGQPEAIFNCKYFIMFMGINNNVITYFWRRYGATVSCVYCLYKPLIIFLFIKYNIIILLLPITIFVVPRFMPLSFRRNKVNVHFSSDFYCVCRWMRIAVPRERHDLYVFRLPTHVVTAKVRNLQFCYYRRGSCLWIANRRYWIYYKWLIDVVYCFKRDKLLYSD